MKVPISSVLVRFEYSFYLSKRVFSASNETKQEDVQTLLYLAYHKLRHKIYVRLHFQTNWPTMSVAKILRYSLLHEPEST